MSRVICILGMHRSGTSCLAGSLEEAGLVLGDVNTAARHNRKGNRESPRIWQLHDAVLRHSGGSWAEPPEQVTWTDAHRAERDAIIQSYVDAPIWGFKDPRTLLMPGFWCEAITDLTFVGTFRHPGFVAESLHRREGREVSYWLEVWAHYNVRLLALHEAEPFLVLRFDLGEDAYRRSLAIALDRLGFGTPERMTFFDPDLRHLAASPPAEPPEHVSRLYEALCRIALDPESGSGDSD